MEGNGEEDAGMGDNQHAEGKGAGEFPKVSHVEKHNEGGKDRFGHWYENMNKLTKERKQNGQEQRGELHAQSEQREKEKYHDKKWKY
eukprot:16433598-Heterocapsa_arctica.AAC.1